MAYYNDNFINNLGSVDYEALKNQTLVDPFINNMTSRTLNSNYYPHKYIRPVRNSSDNKISAPPGYLPCELTIYYGGVYYDTIPLLFPQSISESHSANYAKESPVGSDFPIVAFSNSQPSTITLNFVALSDYLPSKYRALEDYIEAVKMMTKPKYTGNIVKSPSVQLKFSSLTFTGVCDSISISYATVYNNNSLVKADIDCQFTLTEGI